VGEARPRDFSDPAVIAFVREALVPVRIDAGKGADLVRRLRVTGLPAVLVLDAGGDEAGRIEGFRPPERFLEELRSLVDAAKALAALRAQADSRLDDAEAQRALARGLVAAGNLEAARARLRAALEKARGHAGLRLDIADSLRLEGGTPRRPPLPGGDRRWRWREGGEGRGPGPRGGLARPVPDLPGEDGGGGGRREPRDRPDRSGGETGGEGRAGDKAGPAGKEPGALRQEALFLRAWSRAATGKADEAIADLKAALEADPQSPWGERAAAIIGRVRG